VAVRASHEYQPNYHPELLKGPFDIFKCIEFTENRVYQDLAHHRSMRILWVEGEPTFTMVDLDNMLTNKYEVVSARLNLREQIFEIAYTHTPSGRRTEGKIVVGPLDLYEVSTEIVGGIETAKVSKWEKLGERP
jgi:hypothetical protein